MTCSRETSERHSRPVLMKAPSKFPDLYRAPITDCQMSAPDPDRFQDFDQIEIVTTVRGQVQGPDIDSTVLSLVICESWNSRGVALKPISSSLITQKNAGRKIENWAYGRSFPDRNPKNVGFWDQTFGVITCGSYRGAAGATRPVADIFYYRDQGVSKFFKSGQ